MTDIRDASTDPIVESGRAESEVVDLLRDLIRIDSTNAGDSPETIGEAAIAEYVEASLRDVGYDPERFSTTSGSRQGVVLRIPGTDPAADALVIHGHLDVVPARADDWRTAPFGAEVIDDLGEPMVWGRGAVDMKDMNAMILSVVRDWARQGQRPRRDTVVMFLPDEEAGSTHGGHWIVENRPDMLAGVTEAVGEVGGFSLTVNENLRLYMLQTAEKGIEWMTLRAKGRAGHGSFVNHENAVTALAETVTRIGQHQFPVVMTATMTALIQELSDALGVEIDPRDPEDTAAKLGPIARLIGATLRDTANPTMFNAGYKHNVIPGEATAAIDGRYLPGRRDEFLATIDSLLGPGIVRESVHSDIAIETSFDADIVKTMNHALLQEDPQGRVVPYMLSGGTDLKAFDRLGIRGYGFAPLRLPAQLDFASLFHGVDERVPVSSLTFGVRVLDRFLRIA